MRPHIVAPLPTEEVRARRINGLVRDYPELLHTLSEAGVHPTQSGGLRLSDVVADADALKRAVAQVETATAWRAEAAARGGVVSLPTSGGLTKR